MEIKFSNKLYPQSDRDITIWEANHQASVELLAFLSSSRF